MAKIRRYLAEMRARVVPIQSPEASEPPRPEEISERLALLAALSTQSWLLTGQSLPSRDGARMAVTFKPLREPDASGRTRDLADLESLGEAG